MSRKILAFGLFIITILASIWLYLANSFEANLLSQIDLLNSYKKSDSSLISIDSKDVKIDKYKFTAFIEKSYVFPDSKFQINLNNISVQYNPISGKITAKALNEYFEIPSIDLKIKNNNLKVVIKDIQFKGKKSQLDAKIIADQLSLYSADNELYSFYDIDHAIAMNTDKNDIYHFETDYHSKKSEFSARNIAAYVKFLADKHDVLNHLSDQEKNCMVRLGTLILEQYLEMFHVVGKINDENYKLHFEANNQELFAFFDEVQKLNSSSSEDAMRDIVKMISFFKLKCLANINIERLDYSGNIKVEYDKNIKHEMSVTVNGLTKFKDTENLVKKMEESMLKIFATVDDFLLEEQKNKSIEDQERFKAALLQNTAIYKEISKSIISLWKKAKVIKAEDQFIWNFDTKKNTSDIRRQINDYKFDVHVVVDVDEQRDFSCKISDPAMLINNISNFIKINVINSELLMKYIQESFSISKEGLESYLKIINNNSREVVSVFNKNGTLQEGADFEMDLNLLTQPKQLMINGKKQEVFDLMMNPVIVKFMQELKTIDPFIPSTPEEAR